MNTEENTKSIIDIPEARIRLRFDNIVHVTFKEGLTMDIPRQMTLMHKYNEICEGKKLPFLFDAQDHVSITKEARDNAFLIEDLAPIKASAVIATNLAYKLIAEFYVKFNKPKAPIKIFRKHEDAIEWLKVFL